MKRRVIRGALVCLIAAMALVVTAIVVARRLDTTLRQDAVAYLEDHFDSHAEVGALRVEIPSRAPFRLLSLAGRGALVTVKVVKHGAAAARATRIAADIALPAALHRQRGSRQAVLRHESRSTGNPRRDERWTVTRRRERG